MAAEKESESIHAACNIGGGKPEKSSLHHLCWGKAHGVLHKGSVRRERSSNASVVSLTGRATHHNKMSGSMVERGSRNATREGYAPLR